MTVPKFGIIIFKKEVNMYYTEKTISRTCSNCKYFTAHYKKGDNKFYVIGSCGECSKLKELKIHRKSWYSKSNCEFWEERETNTADFDKSLKDLLFNIDKQVKKFLSLFKD